MASSSQKMDPVIYHNNPLCGTSEGSYMWCNFEPCGIICGIITWGLILYAIFVVNFKIVGPWLGFGFLGIIILFFYNYISLTCLIVHLKAMITDPGSVSSLAEPTQDDTLENLEEGNLEIQERRQTPKMCRKCKTFKPQRAHHCSICQRCIVKMDHHCPWINNCVGIGNHKFFIQFICCVFLLSICSLLLTAGKTIACMGKGHHQSSSHHQHNSDDIPSFCTTGSDGGFLTLLLVLESIFFGLFTFCMGMDQWTTFSTGLTQIDRLQGSNSIEIQDVSEVCGGGKSFRFDWLLPIDPCWPPDVWDKVMGYHVPPDKQKCKCLEFEMVPSIFDQSRDVEEGDQLILHEANEVNMPRESYELLQRGNRMSQHLNE